MPKIVFPYFAGHRGLAVRHPLAESRNLHIKSLEYLKIEPGRNTMASGTYVQVTGKVLVGLSSPAITALPGPVSRSKHMGYMRINIAHVPVKWFQHVLPSF